MDFFLEINRKLLLDTLISSHFLYTKQIKPFIDYLVIYYIYSTFPDPVLIFKKSLDCRNCEKQNTDLKHFLKTNCNCKSYDTNKSSQDLFFKNLSPEPEEKSCDENFKPKFNSFKHRKGQNCIQICDVQNKSKEPCPDFALIEQEEKAHKQHVAKIMFKTAKQQFLASNPAAKRSLGATRKAQAKFISPMIVAQ